MADYGGFIHIIDEPIRSEIIQEHIEADKSITETVSAHDWHVHGRDIFFISFDGRHLSYVALAKKIGRVATGKDKIQLSKLFPLDNISISDIEGRIGLKLSRYFSSSSKGGGKRMPPATWRKFIELVKLIDINSSDFIDDLHNIQREIGRKIRRVEFATMAEEKDATALALDISGMDRKDITNVFDENSIEMPRSLFADMPKQSLREDTIITHDHQVFGKWIRETGGFIGEAIFQHKNKRLSVINVNRTPIEESLGVDLLYFNHTYNSFIMVQYKRMQRENGVSSHDDFENEGDESRRTVYRPDSQCEIEVDRMRAFEAANPDTWSGDPLGDYRLHPGAFYLKLCPSIIYKPFDTNLLQGMYLPLDLWHALMKSKTTRGSRGGIVISYHNVPNYLNNSQFINLVGGGFIGSRGDITQSLKDLVEKILTSGKSVIAAELSL